MGALYFAFASLLVGSYAVAVVSGVPETVALYFTPTPEATIEHQATTTPPVAPPAFAALPSAYEYGGAIPDILINSASYQGASAISAITASHTPSADLPDTVINVFCELRTDTYIRNTTGSGFFISEEGVVLTNAHVAQFLLLENLDGTYDVDCQIRTGSPAVATYEAELLYISPAWILEHAALITQEQPRGTGERDYALLYVTKRLDATPLPNKQPRLYPDYELIPRTMLGDKVTVAGYPSKTITPGDTTFTPLQQVATSSIFDLFTFNTNFADLFSLSGSSIGGSGVSGGPVVNDRGDAIGVIVTRGNDLLQGEGSLNAITLSYINRTITEETGFSLRETIQGDLPRKAFIFNQTITPLLATILNQQFTN